MNNTGAQVSLNESAREVFLRSFEEGDRVLILGGTGWFGRTALAMLRHAKAKIHIVASYSRAFSVDGVSFRAKTWDSDAVARFEPNIILDFAYVSVGQSRRMSLDQFTSANRRLSRQLCFAARLPSTRKVLTISSGASVRLPKAMVGEPKAEAYALGKKAIESELAQVASERQISVAIARAWSVSGGHVQNPGRYALSGMVMEGLRRGRISVLAKRPVYRRYTSVEDLLALSMCRKEGPGFGLVDSGGQLVEMRELAKLVSAALSRPAVVANVEDWTFQEADSYFSDCADWELLMSQAGIRPLTLEEQIQNVVDALRPQLRP